MLLMSRATRRFIMVISTCNYRTYLTCTAIAEGHGDTAVALLKAGAEFDREDGDGHLAIDLAPDAKVRKYIVKSAEREGIDIV